jgi:hypothetical protein
MKGDVEADESETGGMQSSRMLRRHEWEDIEDMILRMLGRGRGYQRTPGE